MIEDYFPYDRTLRYIIKQIPRRFSEFLFEQKIVKVLDSAFSSVEERKADFIALPEDNALLHIKVQLHYDPDFPQRLLDYALRIKRKYNKFPLLVILWIGEEKVPYKEEYQFRSINFRCKVVDINEIDATELLESEDFTDNFLVVLCRCGEDFWRRLIEKVRALPPKKRESSLIKLFYLARLRRDVFEEFEKFKEESTIIK